jgi:hypothetical protein
MINILNDINELVYEMGLDGLGDISDLNNISNELKDKVNEFIELIGEERTEAIWKNIKRGPSASRELLNEFKSLVSEPRTKQIAEDLRELILNDKAAKEYIEKNIFNIERREFKFFEIFNNIGKIAIVALITFFSIIYYKLNKKKK